MPHTVANQLSLILAGKWDLLSQADCYLQGDIVERDEATALEFYNLAVSRGLEGAHYKLGRYLLTKPDQQARAAEALGQAFAQGDLNARDLLERMNTSESKFFLACAYEKQQAWLKAIGLYQELAESGHARAMYHLGSLIAEGRKEGRAIVISQNLSQALIWYKKSALAAYAPAVEALVSYSHSYSGQALSYLAEVYEKEDGGLTKRAWDIYQLAAKVGYVDAFFRIGLDYYSRWVPTVPSMQPNLDKSLEYFFFAAEKGHTKALNKLVEIANSINEKELNFHLASLYHIFLKDNAQSIQWYKKAVDQGHDQAKTELYNLTLANADSALAVAKLYETGSVGLKDKQTAYLYYARAVFNNHLHAKEYLERAASAGDSDAYYALGFHYYHCKNNLLEAAKSCLYAAQASHTEAQEYLSITKFNADICFAIADLCQHGKEVPKNYKRALEFCLRAYDQGHQVAANYLGQVYEKGLWLESINQMKSFEYYFEAVKRGHKPSIERLKDVALALNNKDIDFKLAEYLHKEIKDKLGSMRWYKRAMDAGHDKALEPLKALIHEDGAFAFEAGTLFEEGKMGNKNESNAYYCYAFAARNKQTEAKARLEKTAESGNVNAQYALGYYYFHQENNQSAAAKWCLFAAEKKHKEALVYINDTKFNADVYLEIASRYRHGEGVAQSNERALEFYNKASKAGSAKAAFLLGQAYFAGSLELSLNHKTAADYFLLAAQRGHIEAPKQLEECIALLKDHELAYQLGMVYFSVIKNKALACTWYKKAAELGSGQALPALVKALPDEALAGFYLGEMTEAGMCQPKAKAEEYYAKSSELGKKEASYRLAQIYEKGELDIALHAGKAFDYYLKAAKQGQPGCLETLARLADIIKDPDRYLMLAEHHFNLKNKKNAAIWFRKASTKQKAVNRWAEIAIKDGEFAYEMGSVFEDATIAPPFEANAFYAYAAAMRNKHVAASARLMNLAYAGNTAAQYTLGYWYYDKEKNYSEAAIWCMQAAERKHDDAIKYLKTTKFPTEIYVQIGTHYEIGFNIESNIKTAIEFYIKAYESGSKHIALKVAKMNEALACGEEKYLNQACKYYIEAAKNGNLEAMDALTRLAETASPATQLEVVNLYHTPLFKQNIEAAEWEARAKETAPTIKSASGSAVKVACLVKPLADKANAKHPGLKS